MVKNEVKCEGDWTDSAKMSECPVGILVNLSLSTPEPKAEISSEGIEGEDSDGEDTNNIESPTNSDRKELEVCNPDVHMAHLEEYGEIIMPSSDCPVGILVDFSSSTPEPIQSTRRTIDSKAEENNSSKENSFARVLKEKNKSLMKKQTSSLPAGSKGSPRTFASYLDVKNASDQESLNSKNIEDFSPIDVENFDFSDFLLNCIRDGSEEFVPGIEADDNVDRIERCVSMLSQSRLKVEPDKFTCRAEELEKDPSQLPQQNSSSVNVPSLNLIGVEKDGDLAETKAEVLTCAITKEDKCSNEDLKGNDQLTSSKKFDQSNTDEQKDSSRLIRKGTFTVKDAEEAEALKQRVQLSEKDGNLETCTALSPLPLKKSHPKKRLSGVDLKSWKTTQKTTHQVKELKPGWNGKSRPVKPTKKSLLGPSAGSMSKSRSVLNSVGSEGKSKDCSMDFESHDISISSSASNVSTRSVMPANSSRIPVFFKKITGCGKTVKTKAVAKFERATDETSMKQLRPGRKPFGGITRESIKVTHLPTTNRRQSLQTPFSQAKKKGSEGIIQRSQSKTDKVEG